jgi:Ser/Thr protein kinase RdoA (MazF antagonist)
MAERSVRAMRAAAETARRLGIAGVEPILVNDSNNVSIRLAPRPFVARIFDAAGETGAKAARELAVARHLADRGAPVVPPAIEVPAGPHLIDGLAVTLWQFVEHRAAEERDGVDAARALRAVHAALADFPGALPPFSATSRRARALLDDPTALTALPPADRMFLIAAHERIAARLAAFMMPAHPIHGDTHLGNVLITADGPRWTDFETACRGPREWDIGFLPEAGRSLFGATDPDLFDGLADFRSLCVAVWCFALYDVPEKREAADFHLGCLKERAAQWR